MQPIQPMSPSTDDHHLSQPGFEATSAGKLRIFARVFCSPLCRGGVYRHWGGLPERRETFVSTSSAERRRCDYAQRVEVWFGLVVGTWRFGGACGGTV